eukprot:12042994-Heterocapsa_arctica.AAC.1
MPKAYTLGGRVHMGTAQRYIQHNKPSKKDTGRVERREKSRVRKALTKLREVKSPMPAPMQAREQQRGDAAHSITA